MERSNILNEIDSIISDALNHHNYAFYEELKPADVSDWGSLTNAMIITGIEQKFNIKFKFSELSSWKNVGDLANIVLKKL